MKRTQKKFIYSLGIKLDGMFHSAAARWQECLLCKNLHGEAFTVRSFDLKVFPRLHCNLTNMNVPAQLCICVAAGQQRGRRRGEKKVEVFQHWSGSQLRVLFCTDRTHSPLLAPSSLFPTQSCSFWTAAQSLLLSGASCHSLCSFCIQAYRNFFKTYQEKDLVRKYCKFVNKLPVDVNLLISCTKENPHPPPVYPHCY